MEGGIKIPILIAFDVKVSGLSIGKISIDSYNFRTVEFGFDGTPGIAEDKGCLFIGKEGHIHFSGRCKFREGCKVRVDSGTLKIGNNFSSNKNCFISCSKGIDIGDNVLLGWNVNIRDSDGHTMIHDGKKMESLKKVTIGDHVWIASYVDILRGVAIPDGCVVAYRSCVTKSVDKKNCLVGGYPAKIMRENVDWEI